MDTSKYRVDAPYPTVVAGDEDYRQVRCIMEDYSGQWGELTAVLQYIYDSYILTDMGEMELANMFRSIGIVEMSHHAKLGVSIATLEGDPIIAGNRAYWSGSYVPYSQNIDEMFRLALVNEELAIYYYQQAIKCCSNESLIALIERIILDEELHLKLFTEAYDKYKTKKTVVD